MLATTYIVIILTLFLVIVILGSIIVYDWNFLKNQQEILDKENDINKKN